MRLRKYSGGGGAPDSGVFSAEELKDRRARCVALERAYVHDVYEQLAPLLERPRRLWPRVQEFLQELELGSLVADVGCGGGQYLEAGGTGAMGCEQCPSLAEMAASRGHEVLLCDALNLPYRDECIDAALSIAVIHHLASTERRVQALRELSRVLRVGGRVLITVWAVEQTHRKFESQDVLVPYRQPTKSSSEERGSSVEREMTSTTTSEDDLLMYQSYNGPASDSDSGVPSRRHRQYNGRCHRRPSLDDSSSDLSSPGETCYSFVRRALQKLSSKNSGSRQYFYRSCRGPWFTESTESKGASQQEGEKEKEAAEHDGDVELDVEDDSELIELRHLDAGLPQMEEDAITRPPSILDGYKIPKGHNKSRSLGDILSIIPSLLRSRRKKEGSKEFQKRCSTVSDPREYLHRIVEERNGIVRSKSTASCFARFEHLKEDSQLSPMVESQETPEEDESESKEASGEDTVNATNQLTSSDIANGNDILNEEELSSLVKGQLKTVEVGQTNLIGCPTKSWFNSFNNNTNLDKYFRGRSTMVAQTYLASKLQAGGPTELFKKRMRFYNQRLQEKAMLKNFYNQRVPEEYPIKTTSTVTVDKKQEMSTYYSMPDLHTLCEEPSQKITGIGAQRSTVHRDTFSTTKRKQDSDSFESDIFVEEEDVVRVPQTRRRVVIRSMSVGTGNRASEAGPESRKFSASSASASFCASPTTPRSRNVSEDSEESIVSVIPRKCSSLQSDTSIDSEESIVSVIQRSSSEIEAILQRRELHRAASGSRRASPLSISAGGPDTSSPEYSPTRRTAPKISPPLLGAFPRQYLEKFADCEPVVIRDVIGAIVSFAHCTDVLNIPQWETLEDPPEDDLHEPEESMNDDQSSSADTKSYMSTSDPSLAAEGSCCEDDIPQIDFDTKDIVDYITSPETEKACPEPSSQKEETELECDTPHSGTETTSADTLRASSGNKIEDHSDVTPPEHQRALSVEMLRVTPPHEVASAGHAPGLTESPSHKGRKEGPPCGIDQQKFDQSVVRALPQATPCSEGAPTCATGSLVSPVGDEEDDDTETGAQPIQLTFVRKPQLELRSSPAAGRQASLSDQCTSAPPARSYWEHFLPMMLSVDAGDEDENSITSTDNGNTVLVHLSPQAPVDHSPDDSLNITRVMSNLCPPTCSPDDSLESIEECSEEEELKAEELQGDSAGDIPEQQQIEPLEFEKREAGQLGTEAASVYGQGQTESGRDISSIPDNKMAATTSEVSEIDDAKKSSGNEDCTLPSDDHDVPDVPCPFNIIIEDYSGESDSCVEQNAGEEDPTAENFDSLTVDGLVSSTSNGSSSTASFQTVINCPSPGPESTPAEGDDAENPAHAADEVTEQTKESQQEGTAEERNRESISLSSSQESLHDADAGGSSLTLHRYYHVFQEGEVDNLIDKYVQNLHVISSYYDRASWCVIAEKVQVWTI